MIRNALGLAEAIRRQSAVIGPSQHKIATIDRAICWFCLNEKGLYTRVNSFAAREGRAVAVKEDKNGTAQEIVYGVCSPHAEKLGMVYRRRDD